MNNNYFDSEFRKINNDRNYDWKSSVEKLDLSKVIKSQIGRTFDTYASIPKSKFDFLGHLRQLCVFLNQGIVVPADVLSLALEYKREYGFDIDETAGVVNIHPFVMSDVDDLKHAYHLTQKRQLIPSYSDPDLYNLFGFSSYVSIQQKLMIHTLKKMEAGGTMLACLPTGSGKSLSWQYAIASGKFHGTVIVIVPTNALGTDHCKSDVDILKRLPWIDSICYSSERYSGKPDEMTSLCDKIKDEHQLILYISPEGLTNSEIKKAIMEASEKRALSAIVVDEAHLVCDWGMKFRPEFQFLPGLIKQMRIKSDHSIYTLLLSATFTEYDKKILLDLFGDPLKPVYEYRGDELRTEIEYYSHHCRSEEERRRLLLQLLMVAPKPMIVYVGTVKQSEEYEQFVRGNGFSRVACFSGDTSDIDRERIISQWRANQIDIMVATSAFGMGVDKSDVRTVITAYTPESISRYYQEVGRSGRDGYSSLNFVLYCPKVDEGLVENFTDSKVIGSENLWMRWAAMKDSAQALEGGNERDCFIIDTDAKHEKLKYSITGGLNSAWNESVLSMMARAGIISIEDVFRKGNNGHKAYRIKIKVKNSSVTVNELEYYRKINELRDKERQDIVDGREDVKNLFDNEYWGCYANALVGTFNYAGKACGGCPFCRQNGVEPYYKTGKLYLNMNDDLSIVKKFHFQNYASVCTDTVSTCMIGYDREMSSEDKVKLIQKLILVEANIFVFDGIMDVNPNQFADFENKNILFLTAKELEKVPNTFMAGTVVFFIGDNEDSNRIIFKYVKRLMAKKSDVNVIYVANNEYYDEAAHEKLIKRVEDTREINVILGDEN